MAKWVILHITHMMQGCHHKSFQDDCMARPKGRQSTGEGTDEEKAVITGQTLCPSSHPRSTLIFP